MNTLELIQSALDTALYADGIYVFWQRKSDIPGQEPDEYIVYTRSGDVPGEWASNEPVLSSTSVSVRYYYRSTLTDFPSGRDRILQREQTIKSSLRNAGFKVPYGPVDIGDVDDIGFGVSLFKCDLWRNGA